MKNDLQILSQFLQFFMLVRCDVKKCFVDSTPSDWFTGGLLKKVPAKLILNLKVKFFNCLLLVARIQKS